MRRDEELFKKLNKQKPLVKSKEIEQLSSQDFVPKRRNSRDSEDIIIKSKTVKIDPVKYKDGELSFEKPAEKKRQYSINEDEELVGKTREKNEPELFFEDEEPEIKHKAISKSDDSELDVFSENVSARPVKKEIAEPVFEASYNTEPSPSENKKKLQFRHELKYYINYRDYVMMRGMLRALMRQDKFAGEDGSYFVRSLYFDDIYESCLMEKIAGTNYRSKYRIRAYNYKDDNIRFEKKFKYGQYIAKTSIKLSPDEYYSIMDGDYYFLKDRKEDLASEIFLKMENDMLRPRVIVDYDREAYIFPIEECRITFDKDIRGGLMIRDIFDRDAPVMPMMESGLMVLEVKFFKYLPEFIKRIINNLNAVDRCAISKYVICRKYE